MSLARSKPSKQALDTIAQVLANVTSARERLHRAAGQNGDPLRRERLTRAVNHIDGAISAAEIALKPGGEDQLRRCLNDIVQHLVIAMSCADDE